MNNAYTVRKANTEDLSELTRLSRAVINNNFRSFMGDEAVDGFITSGAADKEIADNLSCTIVLTACDQIIGLCVFLESLLHLIMVSPEYQGTGAAQYFLDAVCDEKFRSYQELYLECFEDNQRANAFYRKYGWTVYKSETDPDTGWRRLFYKKSKGFNS